MSKDEPCLGIIEAPMIVPQADGSQPLRWVQEVRVVRNDAVAYYTQDFGSAEDFEHVTPMFMPSLGDDTVGQLQDHFDKNREDDYWHRRSKEMLEGSTLIEDAMRWMDKRREEVRNRSVIGPAVTVQRNNVPTQAAKRIYRSKRNERRGYSTF